MFVFHPLQCSEKGQTATPRKQKKKGKGVGGIFGWHAEQKEIIYRRSSDSVPLQRRALFFHLLLLGGG